MRVSVVIQFDEVDSEKWAESHNGSWPEDDKRSLNTAVRQDIKESVRHYMSQLEEFGDLGIQVTVK